MRKPSVKTRCPAASHAGRDERIIEVSHELGGCLISIRPFDVIGQLSVYVYRSDPSVVVNHVKHNNRPELAATAPAPVTGTDATALARGGATGTTGRLTLADGSALAVVLDVAKRGAKLARLITMGDAPIYGTARSLGHQDSTFARGSEDVMGLYLRVTSVQGFDHYWSVPELIQSVHDGLFFPDATE